MSDTTQAKTPVTVKVSLLEPIERESGPVTDLTLRKPRAGEMRGLSLKDLMNADVGAVITLVPRIADPFITDHEAGMLSAEDIAEIGGTIVGFFMTPLQKAMMQELMGGAAPSMN